MQHIELSFFSIHEHGFPLTESQFLPLLDAEEAERYARYVKVSSKLTFAHARYYLKTLLSKRLSCQPQDIHFEYGKHGKPSLNRESHVHFNMSHCDGAIVIAISDKPVGVDVECIERRGDPWREPEDFLNPNLARLIEEVPEGQRPRRFCQLWTALEAYTKLKGDGIFNTKDVFVIAERIFELKQQCPVENSYVQNFSAFSSGECVSLAFAEDNPAILLHRLP